MGKKKYFVLKLARGLDIAVKYEPWRRLGMPGAQVRDVSLEFQYAGQKVVDISLSLLRTRDGNNCFYAAMDSESQGHYEVASILDAGWPKLAAACKVGPIIWLRSASAVQSVANLRLLRQLRRILELIEPRHSMLVLNAFPLGSKASEIGEARWHRRRGALVQLYQRDLGFELMPKVSNNGGWMFELHPVYSEEIGRPLDRKVRAPLRTDAFL